MRAKQAVLTVLRCVCVEVGSLHSVTILAIRRGIGQVCAALAGAFGASERASIASEHLTMGSKPAARGSLHVVLRCRAQ